MKRTALVVALGILLALTASGQALAKARPVIDVTCWQYGAQTTEVDLGITFEIRGTGLRPNHTAQVCVSRSYCQVVDVNAAGTFSQWRNLVPSGMYTISVYQARNRAQSGWRLLATHEIHVTD